MTAAIASHRIADALSGVEADVVRLCAFQSQDIWVGHVSTVRDGHRTPVFAWEGNLAEAVAELRSAGFEPGPFKTGRVGLTPGRVCLARRR